MLTVGKRREPANDPVIKVVLAQPDVGFIQDAAPQLHLTLHEDAENNLTPKRDRETTASTERGCRPRCGTRPWFSLADFPKSDKYSTRQTVMRPRNAGQRRDATIAAGPADLPEEHPLASPPPTSPSSPRAPPPSFNSPPGPTPFF